ncbi:uncharacterized protein F4807DRAFT_411464 [Annulohypoxylon truncatum]|uniref:uncharacterized protein n=1 Tax=Annulohypoxylon truncatum TaxID=327061 RepID=UPI002007E871|nr:uncharacterized protein F4807DRAFT_411464 [Annulohypoxylon truncatum]KAI1213518.1 hypothetical protein F4807DRAFT_411464 [Annulohypoxylon truncatum]
MHPPLPMRCVRTSSLANVFVRLLNASSPSAAAACSSSNNSILELLLPPRTRAFHLAAASASASRDVRQPYPGALRNRSARATRPRSSAHNAIVSRRPFSTTAPWRKTQVAYNPQKDEDGNDMVLEITPRAAHRLSKIMENDKNPNLALRISVESGGCHGFQYLMSLTTLPPTLSPTPTGASTATSAGTSHLPPETSSAPPTPASASAGSSSGQTAAAAEVAPSTTTSASTSSPSIGEDDTIFEFVKEDEDGAEPGTGAGSTPSPPSSTPKPKVILDSPSLSLLKGSKVDYTMELIGSQFKIVDNPAASSSCGCGTSFDIKF